MALMTTRRAARKPGGLTVKPFELQRGAECAKRGFHLEAAVFDQAGWSDPAAGKPRLTHGRLPKLVLPQNCCQRRRIGLFELLEV